MGNAQDKPPENFDNAQVHEGDYLQTYKGGGTGDSIPLGTGLPNLKMGAKIMQSTDKMTVDNAGKWWPPGEFYVVSSDGKKHFVSEGGKFTDRAQVIIKKAANYGQGPAILVSGPIGSVKYTVFGSTSTTKSNDYQPLTVNNESDLKNALWVGHPNQTRGKFANQYGDLSVNPFQERPRNFFSTLADIGRGAEILADAVLVPVLEFGLDEVTGGVAGTMLSITGIDNMLQTQLDQLTELHGLDYDTTANSTEPEMSSIIKDPRLDDYYEKIMAVSRKKAATPNTQFGTNQYQGELGKIANSRHQTGAQKMMVVHKLQNLNLSFDSVQQVHMLQKTAALLQKMVPNPPDFDWKTITSGLGAAQTPQQMINVSKFLTSQLLHKVMPFAKRPESSVPDPKKPEPVPVKKPGDVDTDPLKKPTSTSINGRKREDLPENQIHPFSPVPVP